MVAWYEREPPTGVLDALRALGGEATLGDLTAVTGLPRADLQEALDRLLAEERAHIRVRDAGDVTWHVGDGFGEDRGAQPPRSALAVLLNAAERLRRPRYRSRSRSRRQRADRKALRVLRERQGVLSLAEFVEQTGLPLGAAEAEMERLAGLWGGTARHGLDGHRVWIFPELVRTVHGHFAGREPRPAWARDEDPMDHAGVRGRRARAGLLLSGAGAATLAGAGAAQVLAAGPSPALIIGLLLAGAAALATGSRIVLNHHRHFRFRQPAMLRRYALASVVETALRGKGVVSLDRTVATLQRRAAPRRVSRRGVEAALRSLAEEFHAPVTAEGGDLFFGFRNVKRQFLASHLLRRSLQPGGRVEGRTVFDSADGPEGAAARELAAFDEALEALRTEASGPILHAGDPIPRRVRHPA